MAPRLVGQKLSQSDRKRRPAMPLWIILLCIIAIGWLVNYHPSGIQNAARIGDQTERNNSNDFGDADT